MRNISIIVTVVTSNEAIVRDCLETLYQHNQNLGYSLEVRLVWNAPGRGGPGLPAALAQAYPQVIMQESATSGFEHNQNLILKDASADYLLIINDDLVFKDGSISKAISYLEKPENQGVGIAGIRLLNPDGSLQPSTYSFPGLMRAVLAISDLRSLLPLSPRLFPLAKELGLGGGRSRYWDHDKTCEVDMFRGSYMLVRGAAFRDVGLFDESGGQETEWIYRFHRCGWKVVFLHEPEIIHLGSATVSKDPGRMLISPKTFLTFFQRHKGPLEYWLLRAWCLVFYRLTYYRARLANDLNHAALAEQAFQFARQGAKPTR